MTDKRVEVGTFCTVETSKYAEHGVQRGDVVYLAGEFDTPVDEYTVRKLFIAAWMEDGEVLGEKGGFTVDPYKLKPVSVSKQKKLKKAFEEKYAEKEETE